MALSRSRKARACLRPHRLVGLKSSALRSRLQRRCCGTIVSPRLCVNEPGRWQRQGPGPRQSHRGPLHPNSATHGSDAWATRRSR
ncbi:hypothetical protein NDU88_005619 [Pleurodeles waltl]|uniref:Uncharacterized protein n=1 Tax=Pleurodeles waltl TaxID=8319 RepID=A0AAV7UJ90_PLEWA|nr:hypothetical protein NDU88_005619 [Pleurodeles waltl]